MLLILFLTMEYTEPNNPMQQYILQKFSSYQIPENLIKPRYSNELDFETLIRQPIKRVKDNDKGNSRGLFSVFKFVLLKYDSNIRFIKNLK